MGFAFVLFSMISFASPYSGLEAKFPRLPSRSRVSRRAIAGRRVATPAHRIAQFRAVQRDSLVVFRAADRLVIWELPGEYPRNQQTMAHLRIGGFHPSQTPFAHRSRGVGSFFHFIHGFLRNQTRTSPLSRRVSDRFRKRQAVPVGGNHRQRVGLRTGAGRLGYSGTLPWKSRILVS